MKSLIKPLRDIGFVTLALTLALTANFAYGQWANPTQDPVGGNVSLPINTSTNLQVKEGGLIVNMLLAVGGVAAQVEMQSPRYCDENGENCWVPGTGAPT